jgi:hypothetical protein
MPTAPESSRVPNRRTVASGAPRRRNWMPSMTMLGRIRSTTALFTSTTRLKSGVARDGKPKPMAPLMNAAASTTAAIAAGITARA